MTDQPQAPQGAARDRTLFEAGTCTPLHADPTDALAAGQFTMYDDVTASLIPSNAVAAAYYGNGPFANYGSVRADLPHAILAPTMLRPFSGNMKDINDWQHGVSWDCEPSLFTAEQAGELVRQTRAQGVMPRLYFPLSWAQAVVASVAAAGFKRSDVMLHTAHWTFVPHICSGITTSQWGTISADSTQYTDQALGRSLDASLCAPHCLGPFGTSPAPKPGKPSTGTVYGAWRYNFDRKAFHIWNTPAPKDAKHPSWQAGDENGSVTVTAHIDKKTGKAS